MIVDSFFKDVFSRNGFDPWIQQELAKLVDPDIREKLQMENYNERTFSLAFMLQHFRNQERMRELIMAICEKVSF